MKIIIAGITCSMGCMYAETAACACSCRGATHGSMVEKPVLVPVKCSPAAEARCKEGNESGACKCACGGINHGVYQTIPDFASVKISHYAEGS